MSFLNGLTVSPGKGGGLGLQGFRVALARGSIKTTSKPDPWTLLLPLHPTLDVASHVILPRSEGKVLQEQLLSVNQVIRRPRKRNPSLFSTSAVLDIKAHRNARLAQ